MLIVSFAFWGVGDMLRMGGRTTEVAHVGGTKHSGLRLGRRRVGVGQRGEGPVQPPARGHPAPDRPAAGARAGAALRPACARARGSHPARRARLHHPAVRPGGQRRRGARRDRAQSGLRRHRRLVRSPALPQPPAAGAHQRGAVHHRHPPRDRGQPAVRRGAPRRARAQVAARRHLQDGGRAARRRDDLHPRFHHRRCAQAHGRAAQRLLRGQQDQVPDPRVPRLLLRAADGRRCHAAGRRDRRHGQAGIRRPLRASSARPRSATSTRRWPTARTRPRRSSPPSPAARRWRTRPRTCWAAATA